MSRPLRESQLSYAGRDAALLLPLLRELAEELKPKKVIPRSRARLATCLWNEAPPAASPEYRQPQGYRSCDKIRNLGSR